MSGRIIWLCTKNPQHVLRIRPAASPAAGPKSAAPSCAVISTVAMAASITGA